MAIKAGQILHVANQFVVDRIQTGGAGQLNIPQEKVFELGNQQSVGIVRDVPDLTFSLECLDVDTEVEAILTGSANPTADPASTPYELAKAKPIDIISPWKTPYGEFTAVRGVAVPGLYLESASYRYGLSENAGETFSLRGDSIFYVPGTPYQDIAVGDGTVDSYTFEHGPALLYKEGGQSLYALAVSIDGERIPRVSQANLALYAARGEQAYADSVAVGAGVDFALAPEDGAKVSLVYGSQVVATYNQSVHQGTSIKPAAIRGKDIDVFFSTAIPGVDLGAGVGAPVEIRWPDVQSATIDWRITLEEDKEFGNARVVARDATDVPAVSGAIEIKPRSVEAFYARLRQITGISDVNQIMGPQSSLTGALRIELRNPESGGTTASSAGSVLKTHYVDAARFTMPGYEGRVQQKMTTTLNWESDTGNLVTFKGPRA